MDFKKVMTFFKKIIPSGKTYQKNGLKNEDENLYHANKNTHCASFRKENTGFPIRSGMTRAFFYLVMLNCFTMFNNILA